MKVLRSVRSGRCARHDSNAPQRVLGVRRPAHALEHRGAGMLERDIQIRQHALLAHQRDDGVDMRIRIDVVQAHPDTERAQRAHQIEKRVCIRSSPRQLTPR